MEQHLRRLMVAIAAFFIGTMAVAELPQTDAAGLDALAERLRADWQARRGAEYQQLKSMRSGFWGELNADPERELMGVLPDGTPIIYHTSNSNAAITTRANALHPGGISGYDLDGSSAWGLSVWDNGVANPTHPEFNGRAIIGDNSTDYAAHANHTAGTLAAGGVNANAKGMSYAAYLNTFDWGMDNVEMTENANWLRVSSHSYHSGGDYNVYNWQSADIDEIAVLAPYYLIVMAAANDGPGYSTIPSSNLSKNVLTVGATQDVPTYTGPGSVSIAGFSSRGPTADGRLKPEVVGNGVNLYSTLSAGYTYMSGTSMSTPNVAGTLFLLVEHYQITHQWAPLLSSTLKAVVIHTADECGAWDGPDYIYGYGLVNAQRAAELISDDLINSTRLQQLTLEQGELYTYEFEANGEVPVKATLAWIDPPGTSGGNPSLVNDLDMRIVRVADGEAWEPWLLNPENPTEPAFTGDDDNNNVEQVLVPDTQPGMYRIEITNDGPLQGGSQAFSLVIDGNLTDPPVQLSLSPQTSVIGENGGTVSYTASLLNTTDTVYSGLQFWTWAVLPNGTQMGPLFTSPVFTLEAQQTVTSPELTQNVPGFAPPGQYNFIAYAGEFPAEMWTDSFNFTKQFTASLDDPVNDWNAGGELLAEAAPLPEGFVMERPWPNPFNASTRIRVQLDAPSRLTLKVYDVQGRLVNVLANEKRSIGRHDFVFAAGELASGVYFVRAELNGVHSGTQKLVYVR